MATDKYTTAFFRVEREIWEQFGQLCKDNDITASQVLKAFVSKCLDEKSLPLSNTLSNIMSNTSNITSDIQLDEQIKKYVEESYTPFFNGLVDQLNGLIQEVKDLKSERLALLSNIPSDNTETLLDIASNTMLDEVTKEEALCVTNEPNEPDSYSLYTPGALAKELGKSEQWIRKYRAKLVSLGWEPVIQPNGHWLYKKI